MARWRGYFGLEDVGLTPVQRSTLISALCTLGPAQHKQPSHLCHWCSRLDGKAVIFEAWFQEDNLTINRFKSWLADIYGVAVGDIDHGAQQISFAGHASMIITFSYGLQDRIRVVVFGGVGSDYLVSNAEVLGYLAANQEDWGDEV